MSTPTIMTNESNYIEMAVGGVVLGFSYKTLVAFNDFDGFCVRPNEWGPTTGKHMNRFCNGADVRANNTVTYAEFIERLDRNFQGAAL